MGTIFPQPAPPIAIHTIFLQMSKQFSLYIYKYNVTCDHFQTELFHPWSHLPRLGYETWRACMFISELAVWGGRAYLGVPPLPQVVWHSLQETDEQASKCCRPLAEFIQSFCFHSETMLSNGKRLFPSSPHDVTMYHVKSTQWDCFFHLQNETMVWLILTLQILRIPRTLLEAFVYVRSQCFILFSWDFFSTIVILFTQKFRLTH